MFGMVWVRYIHQGIVISFSHSIMVDPNIAAFIDRQCVLLTKERQAEVERTSLLLSNCGPKLLERKGLSLGGLGVANINIGLGGKTYGLFSFSRVPFLTYISER
jgi:hypothetical protein